MVRWLIVPFAWMVLIAVDGAAAVAADACRVPTQPGVAFVLDDSGSMSTNDPANLRGTAAGVGVEQMPDRAVAAASTFEDVASEIFAPTTLGADRSALKTQIAGELGSTGGTNYEVAFTEAKRQLDAMPASVDRKAVVFLSDGEPNSAYTADASIAAAGVPIFTIGFGDAPGDELAGIAARSGAQAFVVRSAGEAQAVFARIISILTCDAAQLTDTVLLDPGETRSFSFAIAPTDREFRSLAAWSTGAVTVRLRRPDGSALESGSERAGESVVQDSTYAQARGVDPAVGGWALEVTADSTNISQVAVSIDVWKRTSADPPGAATLHSPGNGAVVDGGPLTFRWTDARGATSYDLYVDGRVVAQAGSATSATVAVAAGTHEWLVAARNAFGGTPSERWSFTVRATPDDLARRFRPYVFFDHNDDWRPLNVESFLAEGRPRLCTGTEDHPSCPVQATSSAVLANAAPGSFLRHVEIDGNHRSSIPECLVDGLFDCNSGPRTEMYFNRVRSDPFPEYQFISYWLYYRYNRGPYSVRSHESDWEGVTLVVPERDPLQRGFVYAVLFGHGHGFKYDDEVLRCGPGHEDRCTTASARVNIYPASGSHASYPRRCGGPCNQTGAGVPFIPYDEASFDGDNPWGRNEDPSAVVEFPAGPSSFLRFTGTWDPTGHVDTPGRGANVVQFSTPWEFRCTNRWTSGGSDGDQYDCDLPRARAAATSDAARECASWFGPMTNVVACDGEQLLAATREGRLSAPASFAVTAPGSRSGGAPGLAQSVGAVLRPGQRVTVAGTAPTTTRLTLRVADRGSVAVVDAGGLGLQRGGKSTVRIARDARRRLRITLTDPRGRRRALRATVVLKAGRAALPRSLRARRRGRAVWVLARVSPGSRVALEAATAGGRRGFASRVVRADRHGHVAAVWRLPARARYIRAQTLRRGGSPSRVVTVRVR